MNSIVPAGICLARPEFLLIGLLSSAVPPLAAQSPPPDCLAPAGSVDLTFFRAQQPAESFLGAALGAQEIEGGKFLVNMWGTFSSGGTSPTQRPFMVRLNRDGTIDPAFELQTGDLDRVWGVHAFAVSSNGTIAAASSGVGTEGFLYGHLEIARPDGSLIFSAYTGIDNSKLIRSLTWQADGRLLVGGDYVPFVSDMPGGLARLFNDGSLDTGFSPPADLTWVIGLAVQSDGKILALAWDTLHRLLPNGASDPEFHRAHLDGFYYGGDIHHPVPLVLQADGRILVAWDFSGVDGVPRSSIARLNPDGVLDPSFDPGSGPEAAVIPDMDLALQPDGKVIVAGDFASFNGEDRSGLVRLRGDGSVDLSFDSAGLVQFGRSITWLRDGSFLATDAVFGFGGSMSPYHLQGDQPLRLEIAQLLTERAWRVRLSSLAGDTYVIDSSPDLKKWGSLATNKATACWLDFTNSPVEPAVFFRARRVQD